MKPILIAQLTDTHIRAGGELAYGKVDTARFLRRAVIHINELDPQPDAVVITGDLVDFGSSDEYATFRELIEPLRAPRWVIPGNHDSSQIWREFPDCAHLRPADGLGYETSVGDVRLVLFDSTVAGAPYGVASEERCRWLADVLSAHAERPSLLFLHHPPFVTGVEHMDLNNCREWERLAQTVSSCPGLLAVACGHVHRTIQGRVGGKNTIVAPSPAHAVTLDQRPGAPATFHFEPPGILLHRVTMDAEGSWNHVVHLSHIGDFEGPYPFFRSDGTLT